MRIAKFIHKCGYYAINTLYFLFARKPILVHSCIVQNGSHLIHNNWGDDINYYMLAQITNRPVVNYRQTLLKHMTNYLCIGSIIEPYINVKAVIWGSGAMHGNRQLKSKPAKVLAVRGPLTRKYLMNQGIDCPPVYGDPALLLPKIYNPQNIRQKHTIGIIPHQSELKLPIIKDLEHAGFIIINLKQYDQWTDIIDRIVECDVILSSSLHGLIVSDAYGVKNRWVRFHEINGGNDFKYHDYFASVNREEEFIFINDRGGVEKAIIEAREKWSPINIDLSGLINSCPFSINFNL